MKYNSVCHNREIQKILPHSCLNLKETFEKAMHKISNHEVVSSWMDAWAIRGDLPDLEKLKKRAFDIHGIIIDPISIKKVNCNPLRDDSPTFLKTFSFYGLPGRKLSDMAEKAFYPEVKVPSLYEKIKRVKQLYFNPCFNFDIVEILGHFLKNF